MTINTQFQILRVLKNEFMPVHLKFFEAEKEIYNFNRNKPDYDVYFSRSLPKAILGLLIPIAIIVGGVFGAIELSHCGTVGCGLLGIGTWLIYHGYASYVTKVYNRGIVLFYPLAPFAPLYRYFANQRAEAELPERAQQTNQCIEQANEAARNFFREHSFRQVVELMQGEMAQLPANDSRVASFSAAINEIQHHVAPFFATELTAIPIAKN